VSVSYLYAHLATLRCYQKIYLAREEWHTVALQIVELKCSSQLVFIDHLDKQLLLKNLQPTEIAISHTCGFLKYINVFLPYLWNNWLLGSFHWHYTNFFNSMHALQCVNLYKFKRPMCSLFLHIFKFPLILTCIIFSHSIS